MSITRADPNVNSLAFRRATVRVDGVAQLEARLEDLAPITVGTAESCALRLADDTVSREHLRIGLTPAGVAVTDEGSRNGTWLGSVRIRSALLTSDTRIRVGQATITVALDSQFSNVPLSQASSFGHAVGISAASRHVFALLERAAASEVSVLLEGESGVGKEVLARALHEASARREGPFVTVDCGAIPAGLAESELFGHQRGAFSGASTDRRGLFAEAHGGTLFLDEIGELPLETQPKLLRALEQREVRPVGSNDYRKVDLRIVAATNRSLASDVQRGRFRPDLYYRLAVARVAVPSLRDRPEDVELLASLFYRQAVTDDSAALPADVLALLRAYAWPGNVRELKNVVQRYAHLGFSEAELFDAPVEAAPSSTSLSPLANETTAVAGERVIAMDGLLLDRPYHDARRLLLERFEAEYVPRVLARAGGVVSRAAELAQIARPTFYRLAAKLEGRKPDGGMS
ncbi:MAG: Response regulator of zinc sigma-54-dependent two-component system [Myxococcaceae bacterium]|nr:Response regulator of zinc sigma-54-dependent two-component system [Myxococcaceae bacterium]